MNEEVEKDENPRFEMLTNAQEVNLKIFMKISLCENELKDSFRYAKILVCAS